MEAVQKTRPPQRACLIVSLLVKLLLNIGIGTVVSRTGSLVALAGGKLIARLNMIDH